MRNEENFTARRCLETTVTEDALYDSLMHFFPLPYCSKTAKAPYSFLHLYTHLMLALTVGEQMDPHPPREAGG